jgi:RNA polymerase sigma factor (sigma-70 family)
MINSITNKRIEEDLIVAFLQGKELAVAAVYDAYAPALFGVSYRITGNEELAENILTATFAKALSGEQKFNPHHGCFLMWLYKMARQLALEANKINDIKSNGHTNLVSGTEYKLKQNTKVNGNNHSLGLSLQEVTEKDAFDLVFYDGLSYTEAAAILNISADELRTAVRRAIKKM